MSAVLLATLAWTGVLIAAVLLLRRPVSRQLGPEAAYALWALPLLRLLVPPLILPAWMAPEPAAPPAAAAVLPADAAGWPAAVDIPAASAASQPLAAGTATGAEFDLIAFLAGWPIAELLLAVWLGGAALFLVMRFAAYFVLRNQLLAEGREVGRIGGLFGPIRLVETPATIAPLALGVLDRVIALPSGFLALPDRTGRDLALAHELAHHRGGDLLVNMLVQPLFALHWFNPLARYGWLALRRDQEAACDARVVACRSEQERAAYARLIASFAAAPATANSAALTAPMACPVLGEKSIIHRLRSLAMSDPTPRRRMAGRALLGAGLLALPFTASISYAASEGVLDAPKPPVPASAPAAPTAHEPPHMPPPPPPEGAPHVMLFEHHTGDDHADGEGEQVSEQVWRDAEGKEHRIKMVFSGAGPEGHDRAAMERRFKALQSADEAEREAAIAELRAEMEAHKARGQAMRLAGPRPPVPPVPGMPPVVVTTGCRPGAQEMVETSEGKDGTQKIVICHARIADSARSGLREARAGLEQARAEIAADNEIPEETRKRILQTLDAQIARLSGREG